MAQVVAGISPQRLVFNSRSIHVVLWWREWNFDVCSLSISVSPVTVTPPMLHTHSFIYHRHCIKFSSQYFSFPCQYHSTNAPHSFILLPPTLYNVFSQYFSFPCQYHSTNAPHSFILLPPTLYNVFITVLQFPLSVSFHQSSILIHSPTTNAVEYFSPSTSVSPVTIIPPMLHTHSFICHRRCITFFSQHFSFPCQYHSTNAPYPFIHLPPTLYNVFLPALQFPLSVSFHQCSITIHSSATDAV